MKATIEIPDDLYRRVRAKSALEGRPVRAVTIELFERWLDEAVPSGARTPTHALDNWFRLADDLMKDAPPGPSAREHLAEDRRRLDRQ